MKRKIAKGRDDLVRMSIKYKGYKRKIREKYPYGDKRYPEKVKKVSIKLDSVKRAIRKIDSVILKIKELNFTFQENFGFSLYQSVSRWKDRRYSKNDPMFNWMLLSRKMFCKYSIEKGIGSSYVSNFIGWEGWRAAIYRGHINHKIKSDEKVLSDWTNFKNLMNK